MSDGPTSYGWEGDGHAAPTVQFHYPDEPDASHEADLQADRQEITRRVIGWLSTGRAGPLAIGRRLLLLDWLLAGRPMSQRTLAARLGVSESRVSRAVKLLRRQLHGFTEPPRASENRQSSPSHW